MKRRDFLKYSLRSLAVATVGKGFYNTTGGQVELVRVPVKIRNLPAPLVGLKIGLLTDFHSSLIVSSRLIKASGQLIMSEKPDMNSPDRRLYFRLHEVPFRLDRQVRQ